MLLSGKAFVVPSFSSFSVRGSTQGLVHGSKVLLSLSHSHVQTVCTAVLSVSGELLAALHTGASQPPSILRCAGQLPQTLLGHRCQLGWI